VQVILSERFDGSRAAQGRAEEGSKERPGLGEQPPTKRAAGREQASHIGSGPAEFQQRNGELAFGDW